MQNYPRGDFHTCLEDRSEKRVVARFHLGLTFLQKDKFGQRQGRTLPRGEIHHGVETIRVTYP